MSSLDSRRHIDWLLERLLPVSAELTGLRRDGVAMDIFCYWVSRDGHGGPTLSPRQMRDLVTLELDCDWDVYWGGPRDD